MIPLVIPRCLRGNLDRHLSFFKLKLSKCFTLLDSMLSIRSSFRSLVNSVLIIFFGVSSMTIVVLLTYLGLALSLVDVALASILMHVVSIRSLFVPVFWVPEKKQICLTNVYKRFLEFMLSCIIFSLHHLKVKFVLIFYEALVWYLLICFNYIGSNTENKISMS